MWNSFTWKSVQCDRLTVQGRGGVCGCGVDAGARAGGAGRGAGEGAGGGRVLQPRAAPDGLRPALRRAACLRARAAGASLKPREVRPLLLDSVGFWAAVRPCCDVALLPAPYLGRVQPTHPACCPGPVGLWAFKVKRTTWSDLSRLLHQIGHGPSPLRWGIMFPLERAI